MLRAAFHLKLQNFLILSIERFDAENSGGNAIDSAVIHIWNDFNQMPYNVGMAPASLQTFIAYFWIMPGNAEVRNRCIKYMRMGELNACVVFRRVDLFLYDCTHAMKLWCTYDLAHCVRNISNSAHFKKDSRIWMGPCLLSVSSKDEYIYFSVRIKTNSQCIALIYSFWSSFENLFKNGSYTHRITAS